MKSLQNYINEALDITDRTFLSDCYTEKIKTPSGKKIYMDSIRYLSSCYLPGVGKITGSSAKTYNQKVSDFISNGLNIDTKELYGEFNYQKYYMRSIQSSIMVISDKGTKAGAQKDEEPIDYMLRVKISFVEDVMKEANENKMKKEIANLLGMDVTNIFAEKEESVSGVLNHNGNKFKSRHLTFNIFVEPDTLASIIK